MPPQQIKLHKKSRLLELRYADGSHYQLSCEFLRVFSPSAEVRGHGRGQEVLQTGKLNVEIRDIIAVGNYAIQLVFDDGHDSGIYSWRYLRELGENHQTLWEGYLAELRAANASRDPDEQVVTLVDPNKG
ncbi:MAG: 1-(5-phosphoribosyl)-5-((5-phosphoribosylamino)methylideneamino)imidazole-4-carboxamide isomerase [Spongiibacter sp.]|nr:1-(5-phosphoribosyl)-5-((5-phosphoribosylamino)methylideneamino)imidazole-4-carboxamide isomerase [Spongiibacter sp.]